MRQVTLCLLVKDDSRHIVLGMKKEGFGTGNYNGFGGKQKENESLTAAAVRELWEEAGVRTGEDNLRKVGELTFIFPARTEWNQCMHIYIVNQWLGDPVESKEMKPEVFDINSIPYDKMWEADRHWLPLVLEGHYVAGEFRYTDKQELLEVNLQKQASR